MSLPTSQLAVCSNSSPLPAPARPPPPTPSPPLTPFTHLDFVVAITGHICCLIPKHLSFPAVREGIPDARPFPFLVPGTLRLEGGTAHPPGESCKWRPELGSGPSHSLPCSGRGTVGDPGPGPGTSPSQQPAPVSLGPGACRADGGRHNALKYFSGTKLSPISILFV